MNFEDYLKEQIKKHPSVMPQDIVKMCYQAAFGAEHLLSDIKAAEEYFNTEFSSVKESTADLYEFISPEFCRVNLATWKKLGFHKERLFEMFRITAEQKNDSGYEKFSDLINNANEAAKSGEFPFSYENWRAFIEEYNKNGVRPVHHSENYRNNEYPAYRIVASRFMQNFSDTEKK